MIIQSVINSAIEYFGNDVKRINHFIKVYEFAKLIAFNENIDKKTMDVLEVAAVLHDIGIKNAEKKYNSSLGKYQEIEGPAVADNILTKLDYDKDFIERVKYLVGHHHTYNDIDGIDYQILVEADFLVNIYEDSIYERNVIDNSIKQHSKQKNISNTFESDKGKIEHIREKIFKTETGIKLLNLFYA